MAGEGTSSADRLGTNGVRIGHTLVAMLFGRFDEAGAEVSLDADERFLSPVGVARLVGGVEVGEHLLQLSARPGTLSHHVRHFGVHDADLLEGDLLAGDLLKAAPRLGQHIRPFFGITLAGDHVAEEATVQVDVLVLPVETGDAVRFAEDLGRFDDLAVAEEEVAQVCEAR